MKKRYLLALALSLAFGLAALAQMDDQQRAKDYWTFVNDQTYELSWYYETEPPTGFYRGSPPHGLILRSYMNGIAYDAVTRKLGSFPANSMLYKENHMPTDDMSLSAEFDRNDRAVSGFEGNLDSTTLMVKIPGYNPEAGDWFWAKFQPDGSIDAAGKPGGCIGCHSQVRGNDWVFDAEVR